MKRLDQEFSAPAQVAGAGRRNGFTLVQLLTVMAMAAILSAVLLGVFSRGRESARRAQCDMKLKAITMALDAFRQENGRYPEHLDELVSKKYLTDKEMLRCPSDPRPAGSLNDYYVLRYGRDSGEVPIMVCPLCENDGNVGLQAFKGRYTKQFATRPAQITDVVGATVQRPSKNPIAARSGMQLRGGDIIRTADGGSASIRFADGSVSSLTSNSEVTLLQSFIAGHSHAPLYTLLRQTAGDVTYRVHHGSKFDVSTPTATAGALGTTFQIKEDSESNWWLKVTNEVNPDGSIHRSKVLVSDLKGSDIVTPTHGDVELNSDQSDVQVTVTPEFTFVGQTEEVVVPTTTTTTSGTTTTTTTKTKIKRTRNRGNANGLDRDDDA